MMAALEIHLFGNPAILVGGQAPVPTPPQKVFWLLTYLVLHHNKEVARKTLAAMLWPETDEFTARYYLRRTLTSLRRALGPSGERLLSVTSKTLQIDLNGDEIFCDLLAFDNAKTHAERVKHYSGQLLPDCFEEWVLEERERRSTLAQEARQYTQEANERPRQHVLPAPITELIGREREQRELAQLLRRARLVTLLGPGGSGKTRLAIAGAQDANDSFTHGACFVDLSPLSNADAVDGTVLTTLSLTEAHNQTPREALIEALQAKSLLLVLDNAEHVLESTAALTLALLERCPSLKILVTSRQPLALAGEQVYPVAPLALPPEDVFGPSARPALTEKDPHALLDYAALRLFVERATQASPVFRLTHGNADAVVGICRRLDGMPLAIEMAATRVRYQSVGEIAAQLGERLDTLTAGNQVVPQRQRSLQAAIEWSYNLLSESEQATFRLVSVFHGGWTGAMCEALLPGSSSCLGSLVEKSLVVFHSGEGDSRYSMLQTLQQFAVAKACELGERESLQGHHLSYFRDFTSAPHNRLEGPELVANLARLEREYSNIRAALQFGCESTDEHHHDACLTIAVKLCVYWRMRNKLSESLPWYEKILALPGCQSPSRAQGNCMIDCGHVYSLYGKTELAQELYQTCIERQTVLGNHVVIASAYNNLGILHTSLQEHEKARTAFLECCHHARLAENLHELAHGIINLGGLYVDLEDYAAAATALEEGVVLARQLGDFQLEIFVLAGLGELALKTGAVERAYTLAKQIYPMAERLGRVFELTMAMNFLSMVLEAMGDLQESRVQKVSGLLLAQELEAFDQCLSILSGLASLDRQEGRFERAARLLGAYDAICKQRNRRLSFPVERESVSLREALGNDAFEALFVRGSALSLDEAIALAVAP